MLEGSVVAMNDKPSTYLVLGANGFVGSYLVDELATKPNAHIKAFDRFTNLPQFNESENVTVVKGDIFNEDQLKEALDGVDFVMHSFSATTPYLSDKDPYIDIDKNLISSIRIFELCIEMGVKKIGFISSAGTVYGSVTENKIATELDAPMPVSPYGINKLSIEHYLEYFKRRSNMEYTVFRLTNPYGPRQVLKHNQGVIPAFMGKIMNGEDIVVYGDGQSTRDYIYMADAAKMIATVYNNKSEHRVYNIGSGVQSSVNDIIESLSGAMNRTLRVVNNEAPLTFLKCSSISIDRYCNEFSVPQLVDLENGIAKTVKATVFAID